MDFRMMLIKISKEISPDELSSMKFLCAEFIPKRNLEDIDTPYKLWQKLIELGKLDEKNCEIFYQLLENRRDLLRVISEYENGPNKTVDSTPPVRGSSQLDIIPDDLNQAFDVILDNIIIKNWRNLARRLELTDNQIDEIVETHRDRVREQIRLALRTWVRNCRDKNSEPTIRELVAALRRSEMIMIAQKIEKLIPIQ